jgi:hypothetical protein
MKRYYRENKGLCRTKHDTTAACRQGKVEQVYFKIKSGHNILLEIIIYGTKQ